MLAVSRPWSRNYEGGTLQVQIEERAEGDAKRGASSGAGGATAGTPNDHQSEADGGSGGGTTATN